MNIHFYFKNIKTNSRVPQLDLLMCSCKFSWIVKPLQMLEVSTSSTLTLCPRIDNFLGQHLIST